MNILEKLYTAKPWLSTNLLFLVQHGSNAYGTNIEGSDKDYKGASLAPKECYLGFREKFEQQEFKDPDTVVYELRKFFYLAAACNPSIIEVLFVDPEDRIYTNELGNKIFDARDKFISKRIRYTFAGYASAQLNRIEIHRKWLLNPIEVKPERKDFKLPEKTLISEDQLLAAKAEIRKDIEKYNFGFLELREDQMIAVQNTMYDMLAELHITKNDMWAGSARKLGLSENFIEYIQKERQYEGKVREWKQYQTWKKERNPVRAEIERKYGFDCKHAMHLVRLLRMSKEILETGNVIVKRPDREELIHIRNGGWNYDQLIDYSKSLNKELDGICAKSKIPDQPDMKFLDNLCMEIVENII